MQPIGLTISVRRVGQIAVGGKALGGGYSRPFIMAKNTKLLSRLRDQFENKAYDADGDYWYNVISLIIFVGCAFLGLIFFLFS